MAPSTIPHEDFKCLKKRCTNLNFTAYRTSRQTQRNNKCPRRSLEGSPAKERKKELNENWRPFFHQKIQVWVKKTLELFHIFIIYPTSIFHFLFYFYNPSHQYSNHACKETSSAAKGLQIKAKVKPELNAINSMVMQRWAMGKDRNKTRRTAKKGATCSPGIVVGCGPTDQICTRTVQLFEPSPPQTYSQNELWSYFEV